MFSVEPSVPDFVVDQADWLLLLAVLLPPAALDDLGPVVEERTVATPYGKVGPLALRRMPGGPSVWIQPYTGAPSHSDPRATIIAACALGVRNVLVWDQVIALNSVLPRGQVAVVADYMDFSNQPNSFAGKLPSLPLGPDMPPRVVCPRLTEMLRQSAPFAVDIVYLGVDGPWRETPAEARLFRQWGADVVGHNVLPEAALAQEAGLCFAALVTVGDLSADRHAQPSQGEMRASLNATLAVLPRALKLGMAGECDCRGPHYETTW